MRVLLLLGLAAWLSACSSSSPQVSLAPPGRPPSATDYDRLRDRWTRSDRLIKKLDMPLQVHATLFSPEFTAAYVAKRAAMFRLTPAEKAALEKQLDADAAESFTFFVAATATERTWIDFERDNSVWRITLVNDRGEQLGPSRILPERSITVTTQEFFPYVGDFYQIYTLRFPTALPDGRSLLRDDSGRLVLQFAGPLGRAELVWRLR